MPMHVAVAVSGRGSNLEALLRALGPDAPARVVLVLSNRPDAPALERAAAQRHPQPSRCATRRTPREWLAALERHGGGPARARRLPQAGARRRRRALSRSDHQRPPGAAPGIRRARACTAAGCTRPCSRAARARAAPPCTWWTRCTTAARSWPRRGCPCSRATPRTARGAGARGRAPAAARRGARRRGRGPPGPDSRTRGVSLRDRSVMPRALISVSDKRGIVAVRPGAGRSSAGRSSPPAAPRPRCGARGCRSSPWTRSPASPSCSTAG